ncbi:MAG: hypothetical protein DRP01_03375 [Archaeoglobales archaeon]|nr:MAG: hypothetical protein DRP01_03375 [Archaeoglobales archaeon]
MSKYLFYTGFIILAILNRPPEKWYRPWNDVKGVKMGYTIEHVIAEVCYQLLRREFTKESLNLIIFQKIKTVMSMAKIDNVSSILAGYYYMRFKNLSL